MVDWTKAVSLAALVALTGCGGGGGGGGGAGNPAPAPVVDNSWLTLTPSQVDVTQYQGESVAIRINAKSTKTIAQVFNVGIIDTSGVLDAKVALDQASAYEYNASLATSASLEPGIYNTTVEVRLCEDTPTTCAKPISGSPWKLPLKVTVRPTSNLTALSADPKLGAWSGFQGNASHSGYVPLTIDTARISRRWSWELPRDGMYHPVSSAATADGQVFFVTGDSTAVTPALTLRGFDEASGKQNWSTPLGRGGFGAPVVAGGKVILNLMAIGAAESETLVFDQKSGTLLRRQRQESSSYGGGLTPAAFGDSIYMANSNVAGVSAYRLDSGALTWSQSFKYMGAGWTPAVDAKYVYAAQEYGGLAAFDNKTGAPAFSIGTFQANEPTFSTPVLSGNGMAYVGNGSFFSGGVQMQAYDLDQRVKVWNTGIESSVVTDGRVVYVVRGPKVVALDGKTGNLLWDVTPPMSVTTPSLLITDNLLFISNRGQFPWRTIAIDLTTRRIVWDHPQGGVLSLSDRGVLYISRSDSATGLAAINLR